MNSSGPLKGIAYMIATVFLLSISDAAAKWLAPHYPAIQIICVRALLGVGPALCLVLWRGGFWCNSQTVDARRYMRKHYLQRLASGCDLIATMLKPMPNVVPGDGGEGLA